MSASNCLKAGYCYQSLYFVILLFSCSWINVCGQLLVPATSPPSTTQVSPNSVTGSCNYLIQRTNGVCMVTTTQIEQRLNAIRDDNFRARLQYMSQNSVLQTQIGQLQSDEAKLSLRVDGLQRDLQAIRSRVTTGTSTGTGTGVTPTQLTQVSNTLTQRIQTVDNSLSSLRTAYQRDAVSQAQTNAALQQQLTQLLQDNQQLKLNNNRLTQELTRLDNQVQSLATQCAAGCGSSSSAPTTVTTPTTTTTTTATQRTATPGPTINPARLQQIEQDILNLDNLIQQTNGDLTALDKIVNQNHTLEIRNIQLELASHDQRITANEQAIQTVYQALQVFNTVTVPNMQADIATLKTDSASLQTLTAQLQSAQKTLLNDTLYTKLELAQLTKTQGQHRQAIDLLNNNMIGPLLPTYPQLSTVQTNVNNVLNGRPLVTASPTSTSGSTKPPLVPPTLKPPGSSSATNTATTGTTGTTGTTPIFIIPPTLRPGPG